MPEYRQMYFKLIEWWLLENALYLYKFTSSSFIKSCELTGTTKTEKRVVSLNTSNYASFSYLVANYSCRYLVACKIQKRHARQILCLYLLVLYRSRIHPFHRLYRRWHLQDDTSWLFWSAQLPAWVDDEKLAPWNAGWFLLSTSHGQRNVFQKTRMYVARQYDEMLP